jgi:hypothetical protein
MASDYDTEVERALMRGQDVTEYLASLTSEAEEVHLLTFLNSLPEPIPLTEEEFKQLLAAHYSQFYVHCKIE